MFFDILSEKKAMQSCIYQTSNFEERELGYNCESNN